MCGIEWAISSASIISLVARVSGDGSVETVASRTGSNLKLTIDPLDPANLRFDVVRLEYHDVPCACVNLTCSCCFGIMIVAFNFDNAACTTATIVPEEFALDVVVSMGDVTITSKRLSAKNPPSMCAQLQFLPIVSFCLRVFDLRLIDKKLKACIDLETKLAELTAAVMHFECLELGSDGITWIQEPKVHVRGP